MHDIIRIYDVSGAGLSLWSDMITGEALCGLESEKTEMQI